MSIPPDKSCCCFAIQPSNLRQGSSVTKDFPQFRDDIPLLAVSWSSQMLIHGKLA
jgi:hypothetical protein